MKRRRRNPLTTTEKFVGGGLIAAGAVSVVYGVANFSSVILPCFSFTKYEDMTPEQKAKCDSERSQADKTALALTLSAPLAGAGIGTLVGGRQGHPALGAIIGAGALTIISLIPGLLKASKNASQLPPGP